MFIEHRQESWSTGQLSDLISVKYGKDHKKLADGNYPVYGSGGCDPGGFVGGVIHCVRSGVLRHPADPGSGLKGDLI